MIIPCFGIDQSFGRSHRIVPIYPTLGIVQSLIQVGVICIPKLHVLQNFIRTDIVILHNRNPEGSGTDIHIRHKDDLTIGDVVEESQDIIHIILLEGAVISLDKSGLSGAGLNILQNIMQNYCCEFLSGELSKAALMDLDCIAKGADIGQIGIHQKDVEIIVIKGNNSNIRNITVIDIVDIDRIQRVFSGNPIDRGNQLFSGRQILTFLGHKNIHLQNQICYQI